MCLCFLCVQVFQEDLPEKIQDIWDSLTEKPENMPESSWRFATPKSLLDNLCRTMYCLFSECFSNADVQEDCKYKTGNDTVGCNLFKNHPMSAFKWVHFVKMMSRINSPNSSLHNVSLDVKEASAFVFQILDQLRFYRCFLSDRTKYFMKLRDDRVEVHFSVTQTFQQGSKCQIRCLIRRLWLGIMTVYTHYFLGSSTAVLCKCPAWNTQPNF